MTQSKIIAVDFDGTLCKNNWPDIGEENANLIRILRFVRKNGVKLILWTCRTGAQLDAAIEWCKERRLEFDAINANLTEVIEAFGGDTRKIVADYYIDDKVITAEYFNENGCSVHACPNTGNESKWIEEPNHIFRCPECGASTISVSPYCSACGEKLKGVKKLENV